MFNAVDINIVDMIINSIVGSYVYCDFSIFEKQKNSKNREILIKTVFTYNVLIKKYYAIYNRIQESKTLTGTSSMRKYTQDYYSLFPFKKWRY